jgi:hypothetical protein
VTFAQAAVTLLAGASMVAGIVGLAALTRKRRKPPCDR